MSYRIAARATASRRKSRRAITEHGLIEDGDRVMVGLSGGKDSWALIQILDVLRKRAPIDFSLVAVNVNSGYETFRHDLVTERLRRARLGVPCRAHDHRRHHGRHPRRWRHAVLVVRAAAARRPVPAGHGGRRDEDRPRPPSGRLHRDVAPESVLPGIAQGDAGAPRLRLPQAHRHSAAGLRDRSRGPAPTRRSAGCRSSAAAVPPAAI